MYRVLLTSDIRWRSCGNLLYYCSIIGAGEYIHAVINVHRCVILLRFIFVSVCAFILQIVYM